MIAPLLERAAFVKAFSGLCVIGLVGGFFVHVALSPEEVIPLDAMNCPADAPVRSHTVVAVDDTDPFSPEQLSAFRTFMEGLVSGSEREDMISIGSMRDLPARASISLCSPGSPPPPAPSDFFRHPRRSYLDVKADFERRFGEPLRAETERMPLNTTAPRSPIVQALAGILSDLGNRWRGVGTRHLVLFSDLMENTAAYTQYDHVGNGPPGPYGATAARVPYLATPMDLRGVDVEVRYMTGLHQNLPFQGAAHKAFWEALFRADGARSVTFVDLPVAGPHGAMACTTTSTCSDRSRPPPSAPPRGPT